MPFDELEDKLKDVLNETIAQGILKELTEIRGLGGNHNKRWGIELIQNALDASGGTPVDIKIIVEDDKVTFSHNGRSFREEELIHLIYHGSTKVETESASGKLGTGFLATHLLSPRVVVSGTLHDTEEFSFILDRDAEKLEQLTGKMKKTWNELGDSLHHLDGRNPPPTTFRYLLGSEEAKSVCEEGVDTLKQTVPLVLAFDSRLKSVTIRDGSGTWEWTRGDPSDNLIPINLRHDGKPADDKVSGLIIASKGDVTVGIPVHLDNGTREIVDASHFPKLHYPLPLLGSTHLPFPALISSLKFMPTTDREGALLTEKTETAVETNKKIVRTAFEIYGVVLKQITTEGYENLYNLGRVGRLDSFPDWLSEGWIEPLAASLISALRQAPLIPVADSMVSPKESHIPLLAEPESKTLWELSQSLYQNSTPDEAQSSVWRAILADWARHLFPLEPYAAKLEEGLTVEKLVKAVETYGDTTKLQAALGESEATTFLNKLAGLVVRTKGDALFEQNKILPDQMGLFRVKKELSSDPGISARLKDILKLLGRNIRSELLANNIQLSTVNPCTEEEFVLDALNRAKEQAKTSFRTKDYQLANIKLLRWLITKAKFEEIRESFPVMTRRKDEGEQEYIQFFSPESKFLVPESALDSGSARYLDVFPPRGVLSSEYSELEADEWQKLSENDLVFPSLTCIAPTALDSRQVRALATSELEGDEKTEHRSKADIKLSSIPFLEGKDGIIDRVRKSKTRATRFLVMLLEDLVYRDSSWKDSVPIECTCQSTHQIHPSLWLEVLKTHQWVPVGSDEEERPSSENLAPLFTQPRLLGLLKDEATHFLGVLGVNVSVILTANSSPEDRMKFDQAFTKLLAATNMDAQSLVDLARVCSDPDLRQKLFDAAAEKKLVQDNRGVGELVEKTIRDKLGERLPKDSFKVEKVTVGSDARITVSPADIETVNDFVDEQGRELFVKVSANAGEHFVEVKSTRVPYARITLPQAKQANNLPDAFTLCVVEVPPDMASLDKKRTEEMVLQNARFVSPIGDKLGAMIGQIDAFLKGEKSLQYQQNQGMEVDVVSEAQVRIRVNPQVWAGGLNFAGFVELMCGVAQVANQGISKVG